MLYLILWTVYVSTILEAKPQGCLLAKTMGNAEVFIS